MEPYQSQFIPLQVKEDPGTTLLIHPQPKVSHNTLPFLIKVNVQNTIYLPCVNSTKAVKEFKPGTLVGSYELFESDLEHLSPETDVILNTREIQNDLLPTTDQANIQGQNG